ncbi:MAG TPA: MFS transporter, partial [Holophagaceae bacterium]
AMADAVATLAPPERRGEYLGLYSTTFAAGLALGPWLGVLTYARLGPAALWTGCFITATVGGFLLGRFRIPPVPGHRG